MDDREPVEPSLEDSEPKSQRQVPDELQTGRSQADEDVLPDGNVVGSDNIAEGKVGGVIGGPHQQGGQGQG